MDFHEDDAGGQHTQVLPEEDGNPVAQERKLYFRRSELEANCFLLADADSRLVSSEAGDGATYTFVSRMDNTAALPDLTKRQAFAVQAVLASEDEEGDIINDSSISAHINKKKIVSCWESVKRGRANDGNAITKLWEMNCDEYAEVERVLMDPVEGKRKTQQFVRGTVTVAPRPMQNGRMYVTIHEVRCETEDGDPHSYFAAVLWVVCHRNFDFPGKLHRLVGDPNRWRKPRLDARNHQKQHATDSSVLEKLFQLWNSVLEQQGRLLCIPHAYRDAAGKKHMDATVNILEIYHPESFTVLTCPLMAAFAVRRLAPPGSQNIAIEGMDMGTITRDWGVNMRQYQERARARRIQIRRFHIEERKRKDAEKNKNQDAEAEEEGNADDVPEYHYGYETADFRVLGVAYARNGDAGVVHSCLDQNADVVDEYGRAILPYLPAWPTSFDESTDRITDDIAPSPIRLQLDFKVAQASLASMIEGMRESDFTARFGAIPRAARQVIEKSIFPAADDAMLVEEDPGEDGMDQIQRVTAFDRALNPRENYLQDKTYESEKTKFFLRFVSLGNAGSNIESLGVYVDRGFYTMQNDIASGKAHSNVVLSTQVYLQAIDDSAVAGIHEIMKEHSAMLVHGHGSDFEVSHAIFEEVFAHFNAILWELNPQNLLLLLYFHLSDLAWHCGTSGNWKWIGMTLQVCDAGGLTTTLCGKGEIGTNIKKSGTSGYDLVRGIFNKLRTLYKFAVPPAVLEQFQDDGHVDAASARVTPAAVQEGMFMTVEGEVKHEPTNIGTVRHFPEGLGSIEVLDMAVTAIPRDDNPDFSKSTTVDLHKTNVRQTGVYTSITGFAWMLGSFAQNQMPEAPTLRRLEDLQRVCSVIATSGPSQNAAPQSSRVGAKDTRSAFAGACAPGGKKGRVHAQSKNMTPQQAKHMAPFFSISFLIASRAALAQKYGILSWDISPPVAFLLDTVYEKTTNLLRSLIAPSKVEHTARAFDTAKTLAGIARTTWIRACAQSHYDSQARVQAVTKAVFRQQSVDALHFSLVPSVLMRYLVSTLDFQTLAVMQMLLRHARVPRVSMVSAAQFLRGQRVEADADRTALRSFVDDAVGKAIFGKRVGYDVGTFGEGDNMDYYITMDRDDRKKNPMRKAFIQAEAQNKDLDEFKKMKLKENCIDCLKADAVKFAMFCKDSTKTPIGAALDTMLTTEYDLSGFFGGFDLFDKPQRLFRALFGADDRFSGMPAHDSSPAMLRVLTLDQGDIALGINFASGVFFQALMEGSGCDWGLQVTVAKNITTFLLEHVIPYSLLPADSFFLDSYAPGSRVEQLRVRIDRKLRPLTICRNEKMAIPRVASEKDRVVEGGNKHGLYEDTAHMAMILDMADRMNLQDATALFLTSWDFEVWWGGPGDVTPLQPFQRDPAFRGGDGMDEDAFSCKDGARACVRVGPANELELHVRRSDGSVHTGVLEPSGAGQRLQAQKVLFGLGWGPAPKWNRTGVVFVHAEEGLCTLVPHDDVDDDAMYAEGVNGMKWFDVGAMMYLALKGDGETVPVTAQEVQRGLLPHGACLLAQATMDAFEGASFGPDNSHPEFVQSYLVTENAKFPHLGLVPVAVRCNLSANYSKTFFAQVKDLRRPASPPEFYSYYKWLLPSSDVAG